MDKGIPYLSLGVFLTLLAFGAAFRFCGLSWGSDAQRMAEEEEFLHLQRSLILPPDLSLYLNPERSSLNPYVADPDLSFPVYGSLPVLLTKIFVHSHADAPPDTIRRQGRTASALADVLVLALVGLVSIRTFSIPIGLLAMALYAFFPLPIAHAHQCTTSWAALFANLLLLSLVLPAKRDGGPSTVLSFILFGVFFGLAVAVDPRNLLLAATLPFLFLVRGVETDASLVGVRAESYPVGFSLVYTVMALISTWVTFRLAQPYAFVEKTVVELDPRFIAAGADILLGETPAIPAFDRIAIDTHAHLAKVLEFGLWGFGPLGFAVLLLILVGGVLPRALFGGDLRSIALGTVVFSYLALPVFQRHPDPYTLLFACPAAAILIAEFVVSSFPVHEPSRGRSGSMLLPIMLQSMLVLTGLIAAVVSGSLFGGAHPLDTASRWIAANIPANSSILVERNSVRLPGPVDGRVPGPYGFSEFSPLDRDFASDDEFFREQLASTDAIILSSSASRELAEMNPGAASAFFRKLFAGEEDFVLQAGFTCKSRLMSWPTFRRWVPPELRYTSCPEISVFAPKSVSAPAVPPSTEWF